MSNTDPSRTGDLRDLSNLYANRTTEADIVGVEAADAVDLPTALTLCNELKAKANKLIGIMNRRAARMRAASVYVVQKAHAQLAATTGIANNDAAATLVALKSEGDNVRTAINAVLAFFRTELVIPVTGGSAIADAGANTGLANNDAAATLVARKTEIDETITSANGFLAKLRATVYVASVPADIPAAVGLANNAAVATLVLTKAEHDALRAKLNAIYTRSASVGILDS